VLNNIKLIVYDFDGVKTDNKVYVDQYGNESVIVSRADGLGVYMIKEMGLKMLLLRKSLIILFTY